MFDFEMMFYFKETCLPPDMSSAEVCRVISPFPITITLNGSPSRDF